MHSTETPEQAIVRLYDIEGYSPWAIRQAIKCGDKRVNYVIEYFEKNHQVPPPKKRGRPPKYTVEVLTDITSMTLQNRIVSANDISLHFEKNNISLSATSINRYRNDLLHFDFRAPKVKQFLSQEQIDFRKTFSYSMLASNIDRALIIFSDESRFCFCNDGYWRWIRKNDRTDNVYDYKHKYTDGIMVYGAIGIGYKSKLVICDRSVNSVEYLRLIKESKMLEDLNPVYGEGNFIFMQDGAPAHKSHLTTLFLKKRCSFIKCWPPNSPDMNPIEHLWGAIKRILKKERNLDKNGFIQKVQEIWNNFSQESIDDLVRSFTNRLKLVIINDGKSISDELRRGIKTIPDIQIPSDIKLLQEDQIIEKCDPDVDDLTIELKTKNPFTPQEDMLLTSLVLNFGNKWTKISKHFPNRTPVTLRNRWQLLRK